MVGNIEILLQSSGPPKRKQNGPSSIELLHIGVYYLIRKLAFAYFCSIYSYFVYIYIYYIYISTFPRNEQQPFAPENKRVPKTHIRSRKIVDLPTPTNSKAFAVCFREVLPS